MASYSPPDSKVILEEINRRERDGDWFVKNKKELKKKYPDQFIAIYNRKVVGFADALDDLKKKLESKIDFNKCTIEVLLTDDLIMIL